MRLPSPGGAVVSTRLISARRSAGNILKICSIRKIGLILPGGDVHGRGRWRLLRVVEKNTMNRRSETGFTLIEMMVAFTILAVMAGVAFSVVFSSTTRSRALDRQMNLRMEGGSIMNLIVEDLAGVFRRQGTTPFFVGSDVYHQEVPSDEVQFLTTSTLPVDPRTSRGDLAEVGYRLSFDEEGKSTFFRREQSPPMGAYDDGGWNSEVSDKVRSFNLRYYDGRDWVDEWDSFDTGNGISAGKIPREIEIEINLKDGDFSTTLRTRIAPPMAAAQ